MTNTAIWFVRVSGEQRGPFTEEQLRGQVSRGEITDEVPAWREGLADWLPLREAFGPVPAETSAPAAATAPAGYAPPVLRFLAFLIDGALTFVSCIIAAMPGEFFNERWTNSHMGTIMLFVGVVYFGILPSFLEGTPGLRALGCRLVRESGGRLSIAESLMRYGLSVFLNLFLGAGSLSMLIDKRRQALYDRVVKAVVIH